MHLGFMPKRFTETNKWRDPWFRKLSPPSKLFWLWLCDNCDNAGVIEPDFELASFQIGEVVNELNISELGDRVQAVCYKKFWLPKFIRFQFGELYSASRVHCSVFNLAVEHDLDDRISITNGLSPSPAAVRSRITEKFKLKIHQLDDFRCQWCGVELPPGKLTLDHVTSIINGGNNDESNLVTCCKPCNSDKGSLDPIKFAIGKNVLDRLSKILDTLSGVLDTPKEKEKEKEKEKVQEGGTGGNKRFTKPSADELKLHAAKIGLSDREVVKFWNYYESNGWRVGRNPMRSWQSAMVNWRSHANDYGTNNGKPQPMPVKGIMEKETDKMRREIEKL